MQANNCSSNRQYKRNRIFFGLLTAIMASGLMDAGPVMAGPNDFFGSTMPAGQMPDPHGTSTDNFSMPTNAKGVQAAGQEMMNNAPPADYTEDEKRMQKKYKASVSHARGLIAKGDKMMKSPVEKESKKGRILKEIGEKRLAELEANNPIPHENRLPDTDKFKEKKAVSE
ncbi:MAG: hypothetical protein IT343_06865 [Candidatus Melainabacteria bacterium]|jgi:hypothetical protein|nr:hypothetical protein [Candidatus Melainabacteria bacterium]